MSAKSPLRQAYDAAERLAAPPLNALVRSADAQRAQAIVRDARRFVGRRVDRVSGAVWHTVNLPTRADVRRMRKQLGELDREVRRLTVQLELERERSTHPGGRDERA